MSDYLDEAEKWLPSELLTEEDIVMDSYGVLNSSSSSRFRFTPDIGNYFNSFSGFTSPVETEYDEDDLLEILLRVNQKKKGMVSPSSTLYPDGIWSDRSNGLNKQNPNGLFGVFSKKFVGNDDVWNLIQQAKTVQKNNAGGCESPFLGPQRSFTTPPPPKSTFFHCQVKQEDYGSSSSIRNVWTGSGSRVGNSGDGFKLNCYTGAESTALPLYVGVKDQQVGGEVFGARSGLNLGDGFGFGYGFGSDVGARGVQSGGRVGTGVFLPREYGTKVSSSKASRANLDSREKLDDSSTRRPSKGILGHKDNDPSSIASGPAQPKFGGGMINDNDAFLARKAASLTLQKNHYT